MKIYMTMTLCSISPQSPPEYGAEGVTFFKAITTVFSFVNFACSFINYIHYSCLDFVMCSVYFYMMFNIQAFSSNLSTFPTLIIEFDDAKYNKSIK